VSGARRRRQPRRSAQAEGTDGRRLSGKEESSMWPLYRALPITPSAGISPTSFCSATFRAMPRSSSPWLKSSHGRRLPRQPRTGKAGFAQVDQLRPDRTYSVAEARHRILLQGGVRDSAVTAGCSPRISTHLPKRRHIAGDRRRSAHEVWNNKLYNSAMYVTLGAGERSPHVHRRFSSQCGLPTRSAVEGREVRAFDTPGAGGPSSAKTWHSLTATSPRSTGRRVIVLCSAA
jgi:hypothetical protein